MYNQFVVGSLKRKLSKCTYCVNDIRLIEALLDALHGDDVVLDVGSHAHQPCQHLHLSSPILLLQSSTFDNRSSVNDSFEHF